jgi:hypothetical protein
VQGPEFKPQYCQIRTANKKLGRKFDYYNSYKRKLRFREDE